MDNTYYSLAAVVALLAANAFFVAAEFALVKVRGFQLEKAGSENRRGVAMSIRMHGKLDAYLAACQLGITMASLGLGWVGEPAVAAILEPALTRVGVTGNAVHTIAFVSGFLIFSSLHIVIGEQVPKTYAIRKPTPVTLALAYPLHWFYLLVFPLNWLLDRANAAILRLLGVQGGPHHDIISEDEIGAIVDNSEAHGEIEQKTAEIIRKAFRFDDQIVREIMVPWLNVDKLRLASTHAENMAIIVDTQHSRFPVLDPQGNVVGVLATKDLTTALLSGQHEVLSTLKERLRPPIIVPQSLLITSLLERMRSSRTHMAIVLDEHGTYVGMVTLEDMLEEIVGEIGDEWDTDEVDAPIQAVDSGWQVQGQVTLIELEKAIGASLKPVTDITTVGGFVMERLGQLPKQGDQFKDAGFKFYVARMEGRRVQTIIISPNRKSKPPSVNLPKEHE